MTVHTKEIFTENLALELTTEGHIEFRKGGGGDNVKEEKGDKNRKGRQPVARANSVSVGAQACSPDAVKPDHLDVNSMKIRIDDVKSM